MNLTDCDTICNLIDDGAMTLADALAAFERALADDPTESGHAAHIRDTIRDNFDDSGL